MTRTRISNRILFSLTLMLCLAVMTCSDNDKETSAKAGGRGNLDTDSLPYDSIVIELEGMDSLTVLDVLKESHRVDYLSTAGGAFVRAIDSINGSDDFFWLYSVNGEMPQVACDRHMTQNGDTVRWHFRRIDK